MAWLPQVRRVAGDGEVGDVYLVGHRLIDDFLQFAGGERGRTRCVPPRMTRRRSSAWSPSTRSMCALKMFSGSSRRSSGLVIAADVVRTMAAGPPPEQTDHECAPGCSLHGSGPG